MKNQHHESRLELQEEKQRVKGTLNVLFSIFRNHTRKSLFHNLSDADLRYFQLILNELINNDPEEIEEFTKQAIYALTDKQGHATLKKIQERKNKFDAETTLLEMKKDIEGEHPFELESLSLVFNEDAVCYHKGKDALAKKIRENVLTNKGKKRFVSLNQNSIYARLKSIIGAGFLIERTFRVSNYSRANGKRKVTCRKILFMKTRDFNGQKLCPRDVLKILEIVNEQEIDETKIFDYAMNLPLPDLRAMAKKLFALNGYIPSTLLLSIFSDTEILEYAKERRKSSRKINQNLQNKLPSKKARHGEITAYDLNTTPIFFHESTSLIKMLHLFTDSTQNTQAR